MGRTGAQGADAVHKKLKFGAFFRGLEDPIGEDISRAVLVGVDGANNVDSDVLRLNSEVDEVFPPLAVNSSCKSSKRSKWHIVGKEGNLGSTANGSMDVQGAELTAIRPKSIDPGILKPSSQLKKSASFGNSRGLDALGVDFCGGGGDDQSRLVLVKEGVIQNVDETADLVTDAHATSQVLASLGLAMEGF
ncbi:hypothetical protein LIER_42412 [Lithospermum erythrorhizon]|uniref:Uncharacterized protein n=1 Tax=Lithospermum erythrorhizon TaxID=34254 RepID=A0AAV3RUF2_LITER